MRSAGPLCFSFFIAATILARPAHPQEADDSFEIYGVHIDRTPKQPWTGLGVYLGNGFVITPAHVAGLGFWRKPRVEVDGQDLPTKVVKDGHFHNVDITLLSVDVKELPVRLGLRRITLCQNLPWVGEEVIVSNRESSVRSHVISPYLLPPNIGAKFQSVINYDDRSGNSGSGIFDAKKKCLLGIISGNIFQYQFRAVNGNVTTEPHNIAKYFVPAATMAEFIPPDVRF